MTGLSPNHRSLGGFLSLRSALLPIWPVKNYRITNGYTGLCVGRIAIWTHELLASYSALWTLNSPWLKHVWYRLAPHMENRETIGSLNLLHWSLTRAWSAGLNTWAFLHKKSPSGSTWVYLTCHILSRPDEPTKLLFFTFLALPQGLSDFFLTRLKYLGSIIIYYHLLLTEVVWCMFLA